MPKPDLGVKRICPETGKKFYDLGKDPVVSPFTGKEYPLSFFAEVLAKSARKAPRTKATEDDEDTGLEDDDELDSADDAAESDDETDEDEDADAPELDEEPIDLGEDDEEEDGAVPVKGKAAAVDDDLDGFSDDEADLDEEDDDDGILLDDEDDDSFDPDIALEDDDEDTP